MSKLKLPVPLPPTITRVTYTEIDLEWESSNDKMKEIFPDEQNIAAELILLDSRTAKKGKRVYTGYATNHNIRSLEANTDHFFRLRFQVKEQWTPFSEIVETKTNESPVTGEQIHKAVKFNNLEQLQKLLDESKITVDVLNDNGFTPLMVAAQRSMIEVMEMLLKYGADPNCQNNIGRTALMLACFRGEVAAIDLLIDIGVSVDVTDNNGMTALHYAVDGESVKSIRRLNLAKATVDMVTKSQGWTPLMRCGGLKSNGKVDVAKELIKMNADINLQDKEGNTVLHNSVLNGHMELVELLISSGATYDIPNKRKVTVRDLIKKYDNEFLLQLIE